ncbi:MAG: SPOR domain-containing protein, partial [Rhodobacteraceae bacterium]|nr:SPOR domain-containing protein [Paracoccaceae bacterium]
AAPVKPATPRTVRRKTERAAPEPLIFVNPPAGQAPTAPAVRTTVRRGSTPSRGPIQPAETYKSHGTCPNASDFSQQFINSNDRFAVRCGPQAESPVTNRRSEQSSAVETNTSAIVANARIVPLHVYEKRQNTTNIQIAKGYQNVWEDDRLNPRRSERTAAPAVIRQTEHTPTGYKSAWDDGRLNAARSTGTSAGDARTDQIWTQKLPRTLIVPAVPKSKQIVVLSSRNAEATVTRTSTRSASQAVGKPKYVRVATYSSDASAQITAKNLARRGLPMRLGTVNRSGKAYRVVLAGPFGSNEQANAALATVRGAGFSKAKISK